MSLKSTPACHLSANFSSATPLYNRSLLSTASHDAIPPPLPVFTFDSFDSSSPTARVPSRVRQGKKSSRHLDTNSVLVSSGSPPLLKNLLPHHRAQLQNAWATSPRVPTVKSRQAWAKARNVPPLAVHNWFNRRKSRAKLTNQPMTEGTYDLAVGNPGEGLDINEETRPDAFELSPAADSFLSTPSLVPDSPVPVTNGFVPGSSPHSPIVHAESVKKPVCTKEVTLKRRSAAKVKPSAVSVSAASFTVGIPVQKACHPRAQELRIAFDPPFDQRLGFLLADDPCSTKTFPLFPSWKACPTLAGDVDVYLNLLPAPQSTSSTPLDDPRIEMVNLGGLKDVFSVAGGQLTYQGEDTPIREGCSLVSPCSIL